MSACLDYTDGLRREVAEQSTRSRKSELGQFLTPAPIARFMASLFVSGPLADCRLLDAGAGIGALTCAVLDRWRDGSLAFRRVEVDAFEADADLCRHLANVLHGYVRTGTLAANVIEADFIEEAVNRMQFDVSKRYTHAILNPPYKKIGSSSRHRILLRQAGVETGNLYSAFVALALELLEPNGRLVAIIPRSFCNGPYYLPFRQFIRERAAIRHLHLFASRTAAFRDDSVLQENIIMVLDRNGEQRDVIVSTSTDTRFDDYAETHHDCERIVFADDPHAFIHVPTTDAHALIERCQLIKCSLADLDIQVSTGPVVDFRLREHLRSDPQHDTVPLLYPQHFGTQGVEWPKSGAKKPNAIVRSIATEKWLFPAGTYTVVRRFSSKEEKRRIVASVVSRNDLSNAPKIGFENHLNVFHRNRDGLPQSLASGLSCYLNSSLIDEWFRRFNGHTQVNATDLRMLRYPDLQTLCELGDWSGRQERPPAQQQIDDRIMAWFA